MSRKENDDNYVDWPTGKIDQWGREIFTRLPVADPCEVSQTKGISRRAFLGWLGLGVMTTGIVAYGGRLLPVLDALGGQIGEKTKIYSVGESHRVVYVIAENGDNLVSNTQVSELSVVGGDVSRLKIVEEENGVPSLVISRVSGEGSMVTSVTQAEFVAFVPVDKMPKKPNIIYDWPFYLGGEVSIDIPDDLWQDSVDGCTVVDSSCDPRLLVAIAHSETKFNNYQWNNDAGAGGMWQFLTPTFNGYFADVKAYFPGMNVNKFNQRAAAFAAARMTWDMGLHTVTDRESFVQLFAFKAPIWNAHRPQAEYVYDLWQEMKRRTE